MRRSDFNSLAENEVGVKCQKFATGGFVYPRFHRTAEVPFAGTQQIAAIFAAYAAPAERTMLADGG